MIGRESIKYLWLEFYNNKHYKRRTLECTGLEE